MPGRTLLVLLTMAVGGACAPAEWSEVDEAELMAVPVPPPSTIAPEPEDSLGALLPPVSRSGTGAGKSGGAGPAVPAQLREWEEGAYY